MNMHVPNLYVLASLLSAVLVQCDVMMCVRNIMMRGAYKGHRRIHALHTQPQYYV